MQTKAKLDWIAIAVLAVHVALSVVYSVVVPIWEAHDEWAHYAYVEHVARQRSLPSAQVALTHEFGYDEASQPPLYYMLAALPVMLVDTSDDVVPVANPYATRGTGEGGVNFAVHDPQAEGFPWKGTVLAVHLARLVSIAVGTVGCLATYSLARLLCKDQRWLPLAALSIHAFAPQYLFINSVVTNDVLVSALGAWVLFFAVRAVIRPLDGTSVVALATLSSLAVLAKYTGLALIPVSVAALAVGAWKTGRRQGWKTLPWPSIGVALAVVLLLVGGWLLRDWRLYGQIMPRLQRQIDVAVEAGRQHGLAWGNVPRLLRYAFETFWASFGWGNVGPPQWVFTCAAVIMGLSVVGPVVALARHRDSILWEATAILAVAVLCVVALPMYRELTSGGLALRGRFLLAILPAVSLLLTWGLAGWMDLRLRRVVLGMLVMLLLASAIWVPLGLIRPAYAAPAKISDQDMPDSVVALGALFGGKAEVVAYELWPEEVRAGEALAVTLWWRAHGTLDRNYTVGVHVLDAQGQSLGSRNHYPGNGNWATTLWQPGELVREVYWIEVSRELATPTLGQASVALFMDNKNRPQLPVRNSSGDVIGDRVVFGRFPVRPAEDLSFQPGETLSYHLVDQGEGQIELVGHDGVQLSGTLGRTMNLSLYWQVIKPVSDSYVVFVHLVDATGKWVYGSDSEPLGGTYPTDLWAKGETVRDERKVSVPGGVPAGTYTVLAGMYGGPEARRLRVTDSNGVRSGSDTITLGRVTIERDPYQVFLPRTLGAVTE